MTLQDAPIELKIDQELKISFQRSHEDLLFELGTFSHPDEPFFLEISQTDENGDKTDGESWSFSRVELDALCSACLRLLASSPQK